MEEQKQVNDSSARTLEGPRPERVTSNLENIGTGKNEVNTGDPGQESALDVDGSGNIKEINGPEKNTELGEGPGQLNEDIVDEKYNNSQLQNRIKKMRKATDSLFRSTDFFRTAFLTPAEAGRYIALAVTSFEKARQFQGKMLQEKGAAYPYPKDNNSKTIADQGEVIAELLSIADTKDALTLLRDKAEEQIVEMDIYIQQVAHLTTIDFISQNAALTELISAKTMLGEVFGVIARNTGIVI